MMQIPFVEMSSLPIWSNFTKNIVDDNILMLYDSFCDLNKAVGYMLNIIVFQESDAVG